MNLIELPEALAVLPGAILVEVVAAMAIESLSPGFELHRLDPGGGSDQLADFSFIDSEGIDRGCLEITSTTRQDNTAFGREVAKRDWRFPGLEWSWMVKAHDKAKVKRLHRELPPTLAQLERQGRTGRRIPDEPDPWVGDGDVLPPNLVDLGVLWIHAFHHHPKEEPTWVAVSAYNRGGWYSLDAVVREVQAELDKHDNQQKLLVRGAERSELFVWLGIGDGQVALGTLADERFRGALAELPLPKLPSGVTAVWAASGLAAWPRPISSLICGTESGWQLIEPPTLDHDDEQLQRSLARLGRGPRHIPPADTSFDRRVPGQWMGWSQM